jgi:MtaA/CmuA family methyltransferase
MIEGKQTDTLPLMPVTMMIAADEIGVPYGTYATDFRRHVEGQCAIAEHYDIDYVSAISDPAVEAHDCGATIQFYEDQPPAVDEEHALLLDKSSLVSLKKPNPADGKRMSNRLNVLSGLRQAVGEEKLVEGWIEGPCAEAADLRGINRIMLDFYDDPAFLRDLFEFVTEMEIDFARAQIEAGADCIGIGDAAASLVGPQLYNEFVWEYEKRYVEAIHEAGGIVRLHVCGNTTEIVDGFAKLGIEIVDIDSLAPFDRARRDAGPDQILLGNIDPVRVLRDGTPGYIYDQLEQCWSIAEPNYIVGAGCEIPRDTAEDNFMTMTRFARDKVNPRS